MKHKLIYLSMLLFFCSVVSEAGNKFERTGTGILKGIVLDSSTLKPLEYANIVLYKDSVLATGMVTDQKGEFILDRLPFGEYAIKISYIGYASINYTTIKITEQNPVINLGIIKISPKSINISEIETTGKKEMLEFNLDKMVVNVEKTPVAAGGNAIDVLRNTPSVTVDADGNVSLRGNSNINILIDGRLSGLSGVKMLEQIPANAIDKIEVVTNPSARYDAEGTAGTINIIMKKKMDPNFNGLIAANAGTRDNYSGSVNLNYKADDYNLFFNYDNRYSRRDQTGSLFQTNYYSTGTRYLTQNMTQPFNFYSHNFKGGIDFSLDQYNSIITSLLFNTGQGTRNVNMNTFTTDSANNFISNTGNYSKGENKGTSLDYSLNYKRTFETKGKELTTDFFISKSFNDNEMNRDTRYFDILNFAITNADEKQKTTENTKNLFAALKSDFIMPLNENGKLEAGYKATFRDRSIDYRIEDYNFNSGSWITDVNSTNTFNYTEQIHALYGMYSDKFNKFKFQAGLRTEFTNSKSDNKTINSITTRNYIDFFPSATISQEFFTGQETKLSYSRRINRPFIWAINPFARTISKTIIFQGNPDLKPEYIDSYEFGNSLFTGKTSVLLNLFYRKTNDNITQVFELQNNDIFVQTFRNVSKQINYGIEINTSSTLLDFINVNAGYSFYKMKFEGDFPGASLSPDNDIWTLRFTTMMRLPLDFEFQFSGNYMSSMVMPQGKVDGIFFSDLSLKKSFLDRKLILSFRVSDVFNAVKFNASLNSGNSIIKQEMKPQMQIFTLSISYSLNNFKRIFERRIDDNSGGREYESADR